MFLINYIKDVFGAVKSLAIGMRRTLFYFVRPKEIITQQYPDEMPVIAERFRGEVVLMHDENNEHACTGCTACELACPNGSIKIVTKFDISPEGKKKKLLTHLCITWKCALCATCVWKLAQHRQLKWIPPMNTVYLTGISSQKN